MLLAGPLIALASAVAGAIPPPPTGDRPLADRLYRISNLGTRLFLDHSSATPETGASVISACKSARDTQKWHIRLHGTYPGQYYFYLEGLGQDDFINVGGSTQPVRSASEIIATIVPGVIARAYWFTDNNPASFPDFTSALVGSDERGSRVFQQIWNASSAHQMWQFHLIPGSDSRAVEGSSSD